MKKYDYVFCSPLSGNECIERITSAPWEFDFERWWNTFEMWYECQSLGETSLLIAFTGGQFLKPRRTEYKMDFIESESGTMVYVAFHKEMWNFPPLTVVQEIDAFMYQKISAQRYEFPGSLRE